MAGFSDTITAFAARAETAVDQTVREVVYQCGEMLVRLSPRDTTAFVSNWRYGLMTPDTRWRPEARNHFAVNDLDAMPKAAAKFTHIVSNAAPYGPALERGSSQQAPMGFVILTTLAFDDILANAARKVKAGGAER